jgi:Protein of unknown function (DUF4089)
MTPEQQAAYVDATAALVGVPIAPYRDSVLRYFALAAEFNAIVDAFPLDPHDESGEVFVPVSP